MRLSVFCSSNGHHLPHVDDIKAQILQAAGTLLCRRVSGMVANYCFDRHFGI
jgi:hypothetical protein